MNREKLGKENIETFRRKLSAAELLDEKGHVVTKIDPQKAERVMIDLLSATDNISFDSVYAFRRLFPIQKNKYAQIVSQKLIAQEIEYAELQGYPGNISQETLLSAFANDKLQAWFLGLLKERAENLTGL